jgi:hypothetical protein
MIVTVLAIGRSIIILTLALILVSSIIWTYRLATAASSSPSLGSLIVASIFITSLVLVLILAALVAHVLIVVVGLVAPLVVTV